jgi:glycosyltransferase involved in cell wall biosynthesis
LSRIPLLLLSDSVSASSGLARITRDLATRIHQHLPEFRVGTVGYGAAEDRHLGFPQYRVQPEDWVVRELPEVWKNFAGEEHGILMTIWDAARLMWLTIPKMCPDRRLGAWLKNAPFKTWGYLPIDAAGPNGKISYPLRETILGFNRVLNYSKWAEDIMRFSGIENTGNLPHGIDTSVWYPRSKEFARKAFTSTYGIKSKPFIVGVVATNQARKDYGLAFETAANLRDKYGKDVVLWIHTDVLERAWSLPTLAYDHGMLGKYVITGTKSELLDDELAQYYSACDVTMGIGLNEGFGFPIFESLACGTPVIHGNCGGAAEHLPGWMKREPKMFRSEGLYACQRPVFSAEEWAYQLAQYETIDARVELPEHLDWNVLWPAWADWFRRGLESKK